MSTCRVVLVACALCAVVACSSGRKQQDLIGRWKVARKSDVWEFTRKGEALLGTIKGTYRIVDGEILELETKEQLGNSFINRFRFSINGDVLTLSDEEGKIMHLKRLARSELDPGGS